MRRLSLFATASALVLVPLASQAFAAGSNCSSNVMVLFDRSTSMMCDLIGGETRWDIATSALEDVATSFQDKAKFGLTLFPAPGSTKSNSCNASLSNPPVVNLESGSQLVTDISAALAKYPATFGNYTPIGQTLDDVLSMPGMNDASSRRYVILVTDGAESCYNSALAESDSTIETTVKNLATKGIVTYVVGFGEKNITLAPGCTSGMVDPVDAALLNKLAVAGGTKIAGCDPSSADSTNPNNCYYMASDGDQLVKRLADIAIQISTEVCDGIDNNCNGAVDEGLTRGCSTSCGTGTEHCDLGKWVGCTAEQPQTNMCTHMPTCDTPPTFCGCDNGDTQDCGPPNRGECHSGTSTCVNHVWGDCVGGAGPTDQSECDGKDHNCDGVVDSSGCECVPGTTDVCGGPNVGECHTGTRTCDGNGQWGDCVGAVGPTPETCDGKDNNCDGQIDNPTVTSTDDVPHGLCRADQICQSGACVAAPPAVTPPGGHNVSGGDATGCACQVGGRSGPPVGGVVLLLGAALLVVVRRRRGR
jgi:MYXO-CTERM domain-containing protein